MVATHYRVSRVPADTDVRPAPLVMLLGPGLLRFTCPCGCGRVVEVPASSVSEGPVGGLPCVRDPVRPGCGAEFLVYCGDVQWTGGGRPC